jgi:hypothetical protein
MQNQTPPPIHLKCRNPMKQCDCITAIEIKHPMQGTHLYQCTQCKYTWPISVGGGFNGLHGL